MINIFSVGRCLSNKWWALPILLVGFIGFAQAATLPDKTLFAGLVGVEWRVFQSEKKKITHLPAINNPRNITFNPQQQHITFVASDASLQTYSVDTREISSTVDDPENRYTQPKYSANGKRLFSVMLKQGQSRSTEIVEFIDGEASPRKVVVKRTAQFDPYMFEERYLYYTTATCVDDCGKMIWELWRKDMFTGIQEQLTLFNAVSRQPILKENNTIYFSSNKAGHYHIWRMRAEVGGKAEQLTSGEVHDSDPAFDREGNLYFIRRTPEEGAALMVRYEDGRLDRVDLPESIEDIRNLEIRH